MTGKYNLSPIHTEKFLLECPPDKIRQIFNDLERCGSAEPAKEIFKKELGILMKDREPQSRYDQKEVAPVKVVETSPWTQDELALLVKACAKVPGGVRNRWQTIAQMIPTRTIDEIIAKVQEQKTSQKPKELSAAEKLCQDAFFVKVQTEASPRCEL